MNTPTIQDVNDLGCCCDYPECPGNRWQHQDRTINYPKSGYVRFIKPALPDTDDLPEIWATIAEENPYSGYTGQTVWYEGWNENPTISGNWAELRQEVNIAPTPDYNDGTSTYTFTGNQTEDDDGSHSDPTATSGGPDSLAYPRDLLTHIFSTSTDYNWIESDADFSGIETAADYDVTDNVWRHNEDTIRYTRGASTPPELQGAGGDDYQAVHWSSVLEENFARTTLADDFTRETLATEANDALLLLGFGSVLTTEPLATTDVTWPLIGDLNPWPTAPGYHEYELDFNEAYHPRDTDSEADLLGTKYKVGIPEDWETMNAAWVAWTALHAAWEAADPETRGDEPIRGNKRSVFECEWEEGFFPEAWTDWQSAYADWEEEDPETRGDAPEAPTEEEDRPSSLASRSWTYGGPGTNAFSDYILATQPPRDGSMRPVNMKIVCYHSTKVGVKPTAHGTQIDWENP